MASTEPGPPYRERMFKFVEDPELHQLDTKYKAFLDLHNIEKISELFDIVQASKYEAVTGKSIYSRYFVI